MLFCMRHFSKTEGLTVCQRTAAVANTQPPGSLQGGDEWGTACEQDQQPRAHCTSAFDLSNMQKLQRRLKKYYLLKAIRPRKLVKCTLLKILLLWQ